jgi:hypothetical protein
MDAFSGEKRYSTKENVRQGFSRNAAERRDKQ